MNLPPIPKDRTWYETFLTAVACALSVVVFLGLQFSGASTYAETARWGYFPDMAIWEGKPWVLLTSVFVHMEIWHIAFNLYWLWLLGNALERFIGSLRWALFFLAAAWVSSAYQVLLSGDMGIGMSGVGYALFGFGWVARPRADEFREMLDDQVVQGFLIWTVGCIVITVLGMMNIGNAAHVSGLVFGALVAAVFTRRYRLSLTVPALIAVMAVSFLPLVWCPLSADWTAMKGLAAQKGGEPDKAIALYKQSLARGQDPTFVWANVAIMEGNCVVEGKPGSEKDYMEALSELRKVDAEEARKVDANFRPGATD